MYVGINGRKAALQKFLRLHEVADIHCDMKVTEV